MTTEESHAVDEMLQDYKESREAMCELTLKISGMATQEEASVIVLASETGVAGLAESMCRGRVNLHSKIYKLADCL